MSIAGPRFLVRFPHDAASDTTGPGGQLLGHGIRDDQAMITTVGHRLIRVPARLVRHASALALRLPPEHHLLKAVLTRLRTLPAAS
ncbi:MAG: transposase [Actinobacteria bacterium]|nr:transposase [Actinomycetota bacterium]